MKKSILKIYSVILIIGIVYFIILKTTNIAIPCAYYSMTGMLCPGCGITRMFLNMSKLEFADAFFCNPVVFVLMFVWIIISVFCFIGKPKFISNSKFLFTIMYISIVSLAFFGIIRNFT